MTYIFQPKPGDEAKWRVESRRAAAWLKSIALVKDRMTIGFAFSDGVVSVQIESEHIRTLPVDRLGEAIYNLVLEAAGRTAVSNKTH